MKFALVRETFRPHFFHMLVPRQSQPPKHEKATNDSEFISVGLSIDGVRQKHLVVLISWIQIFYILYEDGIGHFVASGGSTVSTLSCRFHLLCVY